MSKLLNRISSNLGNTKTEEIMRGELRHLAITIIFSIFLWGNLSAQDFNDALRLSEPGLGSSARALGMGNSYTAISNDYFGAFFNPAGIGLANKTSLTTGLNHFSFDNNTTFFNKLTNYSNSETNLGQIGIVIPFPTYQGSFVVAFGYNEQKNFNNVLKFDGFNSNNNSYIQYLTSFDDDIAFDLGLSYETFDQDDNYLGDETVITGNLNQSGTIREEGRIKSWNFSGSVEVAKNFFVGGTFNVLSGNYKRVKDYYEDDTKNFYDNSLLLDPNDEVTRDFETFYLNDIIDWDITGWDFKLGFLYKINRHFDFGATIKFPSFYTIEETYFIDGSSTFQDGDGYDLVADEVEVKYDIDTPFEFTGGGAFNYKGLIISADVKLIDYSQMEFSKGLDPETKNNNNKDINELFDNVLNYNLGIEYSIPKTGVKLRGGYIFKQSPFKGDPSDFDKKYFTAGVGFAPNKEINFDIAYAHGWWENIGDNYDVNVSRTFQDVTVDKLIFNLTYNF